MKNDSQIKIVEVGPRDGLQNEKISISLDDKFQYIELLSKSGLQFIEAGSFVRPESIKQMAMTDKLYEKIVESKLDQSIRFPCLVPNLIGLENAKKAGVKDIALFTAISDSFTKKNINCTVDESFSRMKEVIDNASSEMVFRGYISTVFGCPYEGKTSIKRLCEVTEKLLDLGIDELSLGDTIGVATPSQVVEVVSAIKKICPEDKIAMHFHDTRGMAITNVLKSLELGIRIFDSSSGGLGGCPYAKGATGNVATEDLLYLCEAEGLSTGIDLEKIMDASIFILNKVNKTSPSKFFITKLKERL